MSEYISEYVGDFKNCFLYEDMGLWEDSGLEMAHARKPTSVQSVQFSTSWVGFLFIVWSCLVT
jgi:hypothetical protein